MVWLNMNGSKTLISQENLNRCDLSDNHQKHNNQYIFCCSSMLKWLSLVPNIVWLIQCHVSWLSARSQPFKFSCDINVLLRKKNNSTLVRSIDFGTSKLAVFLRFVSRGMSAELLWEDSSLQILSTGMDELLTARRNT
jgi:hypothetical protein